MIIVKSAAENLERFDVEHSEESRHFGENVRLLIRWEISYKKLAQSVGIYPYTELVTNDE